MRQLAIFVCTLAIASASTAGGDDCEYSKPVNANLDVAGASSLYLDAAAGFLVIEGERGGSQVVIEGRACTSRESRLDDINLETGRRGDRLEVEVDIPNIDFSFGGYARLDLTVTVPSDLDLRVKDGSGETRINGVASVDLEDGSGEIDISDVFGDVVIKDGSGEMDLQDIVGQVTISDGSGSIDVRTAGGVHVEEDGSGEIEISKVQGNVEVESDGSGGITIRDVTGNVRVGSDGSGSIWVTQVSGGFELGSDGSGSVHVEDVSGTVKLP